MRTRRLALLAGAFAVIVLASALAACDFSDLSNASLGTTSAGDAITGEGASVGNVDAAYVRDSIGSVPIVDVRTESEYNAGHIPTAVNIVYTSSSIVTKDMADKFAAQGIGTGDEVILYCRTGTRARSVANMLIKAGYTDVEVYSGSWNDWTSNPDNPVE